MQSLRQYISDAVPFHIQTAPCVVVAFAGNGRTNSEWKRLQHLVMGLEREGGGGRGAARRGRTRYDEAAGGNYGSNGSSVSNSDGDDGDGRGGGAASSHAHGYGGAMMDIAASGMPSGAMGPSAGMRPFALVPSPPIPLASLLSLHGAYDLIAAGGGDVSPSVRAGEGGLSAPCYLLTLRQRGVLGHSGPSDLDALLPSIVAPVGVLVWALPMGSVPSKPLESLIALRREGGGGGVGGGGASAAGPHQLTLGTAAVGGSGHVASEAVPDERAVDNAAHAHAAYALRQQHGAATEYLLSAIAAALVAALAPLTDMLTLATLVQPQHHHHEEQTKCNSSGGNGGGPTWSGSLLEAPPRRALVLSVKVPLPQHVLAARYQNGTALASVLEEALLSGMNSAAGDDNGFSASLAAIRTTAYVLSRHFGKVSFSVASSFGDNGGALATPAGLIDSDSDVPLAAVIVRLASEAMRSGGSTSTFNTFVADPSAAVLADDLTTAPSPSPARCASPAPSSSVHGGGGFHSPCSTRGGGGGRSVSLASPSSYAYGASGGGGATGGSSSSTVHCSFEGLSRHFAEALTVIERLGGGGGGSGPSAAAVPSSLGGDWGPASSGGNHNHSQQKLSALAAIPFASRLAGCGGSGDGAYGSPAAVASALMGTMLAAGGGGGGGGANSRGGGTMGARKALPSQVMSDLGYNGSASNGYVTGMLRLVNSSTNTAAAAAAAAVPNFSSIASPISPFNNNYGAAPKCIVGRSEPSVPVGPSASAVSGSSSSTNLTALQRLREQFVLQDSTMLLHAMAEAATAAAAGAATTTAAAEMSGNAKRAATSSKASSRRGSTATNAGDGSDSASDDEDGDDAVQRHAQATSAIAGQLCTMLLGNSSAATKESFLATAAAVSDGMVREVEDAREAVRAERRRMKISMAAHALLGELERVEEWIAAERRCGA